MIRNDRIKYMRKERGLTLKEVAEKLGVSEATVQRYESGAIKNVPYEQIVQYAEILNCLPQHIMGWDSGSDLEITAEEEKIILAFRNSPEAIRSAIRKLLDIEVEEKPIAISRKKKKHTTTKKKKSVSSKKRTVITNETTRRNILPRLDAGTDVELLHPGAGGTRD